MGVIQNPNGTYSICRDPFEHTYTPAANLLRDTIIHVAHGFSTVHAEMDFETYSEAGFNFDEDAGRFKGLGASKKGLSAVGAAVYAQHASTEVLCLAYNLKDGLGPRLWLPGEQPPWDLIAHFQRGGLVEAHNSIFEYFIWDFVCVRKLGWPAISHTQLRCSMSKAASFALPMSLDKLSEAIDAPIKKDKDGKAVMLKLTQPRTPTKADPSLRYDPVRYADQYNRLGEYCINDTYAESEVSAMLPDLQPDELDLWLLDQQINIRGVHIDKNNLNNCINIVEQAFDKYSEELRSLCGGYYDEKGEWKWNVSSPAELQNIRVYLSANGVQTASLDAEHLAKLLARDDLPKHCRRVLEIRDMLSASSVKKLFSLLNHLGEDNRVRGLFAFCGADRTGRFAGRGPQPQNFPSGGPKLSRCDKINGCGHYYRGGLLNCPWCGIDAAFSDPKKDWTHQAVDQALKVIASRNLSYVEHYYGDPISVISGCLRGLFTAAPGKDFICSDFSAIEAVVLAELAGEKWRQEVFRTHGKIYEMGAAMITGTPFEEFMRVAGYTDLTKEKWWLDEQTGSHHALRKTIGKVSELASGYAGWIGAWKNFGADKFMTDEEIKQAIIAWRDASPMIVELWGGQWRKHPKKWEFTPEFYGLEGAAVQAVMNPGTAYTYRMISYQVHQDVLYCRLPSGRFLCYHTPRLVQSTAPHGNPVWQLTYMGSDAVTGQWVRLNTYGGKLAENVTQAVARDILTHSMKNLEKAGYPIVLHIHDEIVAEVNKGEGSIEEFERVMAIMPPWASDWPIRAAGGWRGLRYRKG